MYLNPHHIPYTKIYLLAFLIFAALLALAVKANCMVATAPTTEAEVALKLPRLEVTPAQWDHLEVLGFECPYVIWKSAGQEEKPQRPMLAATVTGNMFGAATLPTIQFSPALNSLLLIILLLSARLLITRKTQS